MSTDHSHVCVYFEDSEPELLCVCGARAVLVLDEDGETTLLVALDGELQETYAAA